MAWPLLIDCFVTLKQDWPVWMCVQMHLLRTPKKPPYDGYCGEACVTNLRWIACICTKCACKQKTVGLLQPCMHKAAVVHCSHPPDLHTSPPRLQSSAALTCTSVLLSPASGSGPGSGSCGHCQAVGQLPQPLLLVGADHALDALLNLAIQHLRVCAWVREGRGRARTLAERCSHVKVQIEALWLLHLPCSVASAMLICICYATQWMPLHALCLLGQQGPPPVLNPLLIPPVIQNKSRMGTQVMGKAVCLAPLPLHTLLRS